VPVRARQMSIHSPTGFMSQLYQISGRPEATRLRVWSLESYSSQGWRCCCRPPTKMHRLT